MNYHLFVDNFRGFSDTCIPITDVNFLVGENSTGKSSILSLIKLFSGPGFLMGQDFDDEDIGFRHFSDMVSAHSPTQSQFHIGFAAESDDRNSDKSARGCLFTFRAKQGQPRLYKCTSRAGEETITLKFGNGVYFKTQNCPAAATPHEIISSLRSRWVGEHCGKDNGYEKLDVPRGVPLVLALSMASQFPKKKRKTREFVLNTNLGFALPELTWFGPIRTQPKRTYDELALEFSSEGRHTPYLIRRMLNSKAQAVRLKEFFEKVGTASGLFQDVRTQSFGRGANPRFELDIVLDGKALNILNVGYGVSQSLPIIVELLAREKGTWFAIQEPEIHLHPRAQAALGDVLFEMSVTDHKRFLVETHSDYTIDRFRMNYKNGRSQKPESQILFFERRDKRNIVTPLGIGKSGELPTDQPESYRQFFVREQMHLLGI